MEFLGNKTGLLPLLDLAVREHLTSRGLLADLFSGTGSVAEYFAREGFSVHANDQLPLAANWARAKLLVTSPPNLSGLNLENTASTASYASTINYLNSLPPIDGWVTQNYTPRSGKSLGVERKYFTIENGMRIDAVRNKINSWRGLVSEGEWALLMSTLIDAASRVSNIAGTYGSYLKQWKPRAVQPLILRPLDYFQPGSPRHQVTCRDAQLVAEETDAEVAYADPPYTKRQYAAYYHVLNSLVGPTDPPTAGLTGLPRWQEWSSDWCYARRAPEALESLVAKNNSPVFVLSYSSDGHIPHDQICEILSGFGRLRVLEAERRRFKSSAIVHKSSTVTERIYTVTR